MEFLADEETEFEPDDAFFEEDKREGREGQPRTDRPLGGRLYLAMPDVAALGQLVSLWKRWLRGDRLPYGFAPWRDVFAGLRDIRPWGFDDRLSEETVEFWREIEASPAETRRIEAELWFRENAERRDAAYRNVENSITTTGGNVVDHAVIEEIGYEAVLINLPAREIKRLMARKEIDLATCDDVMFLRPQSSVDTPEPAEETEATPGFSDEPPSELPPVAALFDGVPVENHRLLAGRIEVDDPDGLAAGSVPETRHHGTAMASLILHGDRNLNQLPVSRKIYVRPFLSSLAPGRPEEPKPDRLLVGEIHRAVQRMKIGDQEGEATAPEVFLVNISLGDRRRPFSGPMSPWARLLDHLADRHGILFLVSAGNVTSRLPVREFPNWTSFEDASAEDRESAVLRSLSDDKMHRTLLSPAEALNAITVGASHDDAVDGHRGAGAVDPYQKDSILPNVSSALGLGHRKAVKPEIHLPGGREHVRFRKGGRSLVIVPEKSGRSGLKAASPDPALDRESLVKGTSGATALATRAAHRIFDALMDAEGGSTLADVDPSFHAVTVKALLVHRSKWGNRDGLLNKIFGPHGRGGHVEKRDNIARLLGYGFPNIDESLSCAANRATLVGYGTVTVRATKIHRIPLPPSLERVTEPRTITITVAWFSPVNPCHHAYRRAKLEVGAATDLAAAAGVKRARSQPSDKSAARGTVFHARYEGAKAVPFVDDGHVLLRVFCREQGGSLDRDIRYGVAVTIEAGESVPVYNEVKARLGVAVTARSGSGIP